LKDRPAVLFDAYALLAVLLDEPAAAEVLEHLERPGAAITSVNAAEVLDRLCRAGASDDEAEAELASFGASILHPSERAVIKAGLLRGKYYDRATCCVSLADCIGAACALDLQVPFATADGPLAHVVRSENGIVVALSDTSGKRP